MRKIRQTDCGFTLIELLVVIVMLGALAGVAITLLNPARSQGRARDGIRVSNVKSLSEGIQSYRQLEGAFPANGDQNDAGSTLRTTYITKWPDPQADDGSIDAVWNYVYQTDGQKFLVYSPNSLGGCYKFQSDWARVLACPVSECSVQFTNEASCD